MLVEKRDRMDDINAIIENIIRGRAFGFLCRCGDAFGRESDFLWKSSCADMCDVHRVFRFFQKCFTSLSCSLMTGSSDR